VDVNTDDLSAFLNLAWQKAGDAANTLPEQLLKEQQAALTLIATGSVATVAKNSTSQSYGFYGPGNLTHRQITAIFTTLIRYYQTVKDKIIWAAAQSAVALDATFDFDQPIYDLLTKYFQVSTSAAVLPDITDLRFSPCARSTGFLA
jgi:hypothetical protein